MYLSTDLLHFDLWRRNFISKEALFEPNFCDKSLLHLVRSTTQLADVYTWARVGMGYLGEMGHANDWRGLQFFSGFITTYQTNMKCSPQPYHGATPCITPKPLPKFVDGLILLRGQSNEPWRQITLSSSALQNATKRGQNKMAFLTEYCNSVSVHTYIFQQFRFWMFL